MVEVFRVAPGARRTGRVVPVLDVASPTLPPGASRASAERLAARVAAGAAETWVLEPLAGGGELIRAAAVVRNAAGRADRGCRGRQRLPDRRPRRAVAPHDGAPTRTTGSCAC